MSSDIITTVTLSGLTCHACQQLVTKYIKKIRGVSEVVVNLYDGETTIFADHVIPKTDIRKALENTTYQVEG